MSASVQEKPLDESQLNLSYHTDTPSRHIPFIFNGSIGGLCWRRWLHTFMGSVTIQVCRFPMPPSGPGEIIHMNPAIQVRSNLFFGFHYIIVNPFWDNRTNRRQSWASDRKTDERVCLFPNDSRFKKKVYLYVCMFVFLWRWYGNGTLLESI